MNYDPDKCRTLLEAKTRDELNVIAKQLNITAFRKISRASLVQTIIDTEQKDRLSNLLAPSWWGRYHNHVYGVASLVIGLVGIVLAYQWQGRSTPPITVPSAIEQEKSPANPKASSATEIDEARIATENSAFSPISMDEFFTRWRDKSGTDLQKDQLEKELTGKTVIWTGKIRSIKPGHEGGVSVIVGRPSDSEPYDSAFLEFDSSQRSTFLSLRNEGLIRFTGVFEEIYIGSPFLKNCKLLHTVQ